MNNEEKKYTAQGDEEEAFLKRVYRDFGDTLWKQRLWIFGYCFFVVLFATLVLIRIPSYYRASTTLLIDSDIVQDPAEQRSLSNLELQATVIQSPEIIEKVIEKTDLLKDPVFSNNPNPRETFSKRLKVEPDKLNKTIQIYFMDTRPEMAAKIANQIAQAYLYGRAAKTSGLNVDSLESLKERVSQEMEKLNAVKAKIAELNKKNPSLGDEDMTGDQVKFLNSEYIRTSAHVLEVKTTISELEALAKNGGSFESHIFFSSHPRVRGKLEQVRAAELETLELEQEYRGMHPLVLRAQTKLKALQKSIEEEKGQVLAELHSDLRTGETTQKKLREAIQEMQGKDRELTPQKLNYKNLLAEQGSILGTISLLNEQISKASVAGSYKQTGIEILSYAAVPQKPFSPDRPKLLFLTLLFSILSSFGFVFLSCYFDRTFRTDEDIEQLLMKPFLGHLPYIRIPQGTLQPNFQSGKESIYFLNFLRLLCANIIFLIAGRGHPSILITGSRPREGKSFVSYHLASTFAQEGKRTVLVDVDFCRSVLSFMFSDLKDSPGLHDYLMGSVEAEDVIMATGQLNLFFVQSREAKFSAPHALRSDRMKDFVRKLKQEFDIVIFDTPPVLSINDAVALGELVDMRILVVEWGKTPRDMVQRALRKIAPSNLVLAGILLNKTKRWGSSDSYDHYYTGYQKEKHAKDAKK